MRAGATERTNGVPTQTKIACGRPLGRRVHISSRTVKSLQRTAFHAVCCYATRRMSALTWTESAQPTPAIMPMPRAMPGQVDVIELDSDGCVERVRRRPASPSDNVVVLEDGSFDNDFSTVASTAHPRKRMRFDAASPIRPQRQSVAFAEPSVAGSPSQFGAHVAFHGSRTFRDTSTPPRSTTHLRRSSISEDEDSCCLFRSNSADPDVISVVDDENNGNLDNFDDADDDDDGKFRCATCSS
jgi:hypothetical protein